MNMFIAHTDHGTIREGIPAYDESIKCKEHPDAKIYGSYGLAGGGYGPYTVCAICTNVLTKSQESDDEQ